MCLIRKNTDTPCVATEDIVCYKVAQLRLVCVCKTGDNGEVTRIGTFTGPWWTFDYSINKEYAESNMEQGIIRDGDWMYVSKGFHTYTHLSSAERVAYEHGFDFILECVIPKGSKFYYSYEGMERCSDRIKVTGWKYSGELRGQRHCWHTWGVPTSYPE